MYNQSYEDYMREVLGYSMNGCSDNNTYMNQDNAYNMDFNVPINSYMETNDNTIEVENLYPERYKMIYPMVCKICNEKATMPMSKELLEEMTTEIYFAFQSEETQVNVNVKTNMRNGDVKNPNEKKVEVRESENRVRRPGDPILSDLIRILILRELLGRPGRPPMPGPRPPIRPPMPGPGMPPPPPGGRPPMPGGPGGMNPRPPIMPRDYNEYRY